MRKKKAIINTSVGLVYEIVSIICALILPRLILKNFGSAYNGITTSVTQFLGYIALLRAGISGVTKAALYKPLADGDTRKISAIVNATEKFMRKVALIFVVFIVVLACLYPFLVAKEFSWLFTFSLVIILGINTFAQYYFGITYQMLLQADQKTYVVYLIHSITTVLNTIIAAWLIYEGATIHVVKLGSALIFSLNPVFINIYVMKKYRIDKSVEGDNSAIKQRWDAFAQQIAVFVNSNIDVVLITAFMTTKGVSIYSVYYLAINGIVKFIRVFTKGIDAAFGNMLVKDMSDVIHKNFRVYEMLTFSISSVCFSVASVMMIPFVRLYTKGVTDADYCDFMLAVIAPFTALVQEWRVPYQTIVEAKGHFRQTRNGAVFESVLNCIVSVVAIQFFGIAGVVCGTFAAALFRTVQYSVYMSKNIIVRKNTCTLKWILLSSMIFLLTFCFGTIIFRQAPTYIYWIIYAMVFTCISSIITLLIDLVFYKSDLIAFLEMIRSMARVK